MKLFITMILLIPTLANAGWVNNGNYSISDEEFIGQIRYVPGDSSIILESKDLISKYNLNTLKLIKSVAIYKQDSNYRSAISNDDLSKIYIYSDTIDWQKFKYWIVDYSTKDTIFLDTNWGKSNESYTTEFYYNSKVYYSNNTILISHDNIHKMYIGYHQEQYLTQIANIDQSTNFKVNKYSFYINSYSDWNPLSKRWIIYRNYTDIFTHGQDRYNYNNSIGELNISNNTVISYNNNDLNKHYGNGTTGKISESKLYQHDNYTIINSYKQIHNYGINIKYGTINSFSKYDNSIFSAYSNRNKNNPILYTEIYSLSGELLFNDSLEGVYNDTIYFNDGKTFFFKKENKLIKYTPQVYNSNSIKALISNYTDSIFTGEEFLVESLSLGLPKEELWYIDDSLIVSSPFMRTSIATSGLHKIKLLIKNQDFIDSAEKNIYILPINTKDIKNIDFSIQYISLNPLLIKFKVKDYSDEFEYHWNFGDGNTSNEINAKHSYLDSGVYSITLTGVRKDGSFEQEIKNKVINPKINALEFSENQFYKFSLSNDKNIYFKSISTIYDVKIEVIDKNETVLFSQNYGILTEGEVKSFRPPVDGVYKIILTDKVGNKYEY